MTVRKKAALRQHKRETYTHWHVLLASPTEPMPAAKRLHQLTAMWQGLRALETSDAPTTNDWRVCSDAVNLLETLVTQGTVQDNSGLLTDAVAALAMAGKRHIEGGQIRLDGRGIQVVRAVLEDYAAVLSALPERVMVQCHRDTERRLRAILAGKRLPHDVEIMAV